MSYRVELSLPAKKQLDRLDQVTARRLYDRVEELAFDPYAARISKAVKMEPGQRLALGDHPPSHRRTEDLGDATAGGFSSGSGFFWEKLFNSKLISLSSSLQEW